MKRKFVFSCYRFVNLLMLLQEEEEGGGELGCGGEDMRVLLSDQFDETSYQLVTSRENDSGFKMGGRPTNKRKKQEHYSWKVSKKRSDRKPLNILFKDKISADFCRERVSSDALQRHLKTAALQESQRRH